MQSSIPDKMAKEIFQEKPNYDHNSIMKRWIMTEKEKTYRIRKLGKDCYRRMEMLNNIVLPRSCLSIASLIPFICILNTIPQTFIVLWMERLCQKSWCLGRWKENDPNHPTPAISVRFSLCLIERCLDNHLKEDGRKQFWRLSLGRQISDNIVCGGDFSSQLLFYWGDGKNYPKRKKIAQSHRGRILMKVLLTGSGSFKMRKTRRANGPLNKA